MRPTSRDDFTVAIICALPLEADAAEALFDETYDRLAQFYGKQTRDMNTYINGRIGGHNIVLCYMPGIGKGNAAGVAATLLSSYPQIGLALVVGVCGGVPFPSSDTEIFLGDVIVSDAVIEYDFGKQYPWGFQRRTDVRDTLGRPNREIRSLMAALKASRNRSAFQTQMFQHLCAIQQSDVRWQHPGDTEDDILFDACYDHKHYGEGASAKPHCLCGGLTDDICQAALDQNCNSLGCDKNLVLRRRPGADVIRAVVHIGKVASSDTVMKSGKHREDIVRKEGVVAFEMEGAGVWDHLPCIVIKGVSDYADSHKSKKWQAYAAATGASAAKVFLEYWRPTYREERKHERKHCWMVPFTRNPQFVGRQDEIAKVEEWILGQDGVTKIAIFGLGGIGKTQVALELAYRIRDRDECSIFWIPCTSYESVEQAYLGIAKIVGIQDVKPAEAKEHVRNHLNQKSARNWLLIFDNADDMDMWIKSSNNGPALKDFLPQNEQGRIIFTTRNRQLAAKLTAPHVILIPDVDESTGVQILEKSLIRKELLDDRDTTISFLEQLTFLPLAIAQAVAYVNERDIGLADYLELLHEQEHDVVDLLSEDFEDERRYEIIKNPIATTWLISFQHIQRQDELAADYLSFMAFMNPRNIPQSLLPQPTSKKKKIDAIGILKAYCFISGEAGDRSLGLHRLVRLVTRSWMRKNGQDIQWIIKAADRLTEALRSDGHSIQGLWREYLPHALSLIGEPEIQIQQDKYIDLLERVGGCLFYDERFRETLVIFDTIYSIQRRKYGDTHRITLSNMITLARLYVSLRQFKKAEELGVQVLETSQQMLGSNDLVTLSSMRLLALIYCHNESQWKKAEELGVQVIKMSKQILGPEHPETIFSMNNLVSIYLVQKQWKKAEELGVLMMKINRQILKPEHSITLSCMSNLVLIYLVQKQWKKAEELGVQMMKINKQILGPEHHVTIVTMNKLVSIYLVQKQWKKAEELGVQVMKINRQILKPEHFITLFSMSNMVLIYLVQKQWKKAEELGVQVMEMSKQVLGEHPDTIEIMFKIGMILFSSGKDEDALVLINEYVQLVSQHLSADPRIADFPQLIW